MKELKLSHCKWVTKYLDPKYKRIGRLLLKPWRIGSIYHLSRGHIIFVYCCFQIQHCQCQNCFLQKDNATNCGNLYGTVTCPPWRRMWGWHSSSMFAKIRGTWWTIKFCRICIDRLLHETVKYKIEGSTPSVITGFRNQKPSQC